MVFEFTCSTRASARTLGKRCPGVKSSLKMPSRTCVTSWSWIGTEWSRVSQMGIGDFAVGGTFAVSYRATNRVARFSICGRFKARF